MAEYSRPCIGYGDLEGRCTETVDTGLSPLWCHRCEALRRKTITESFAAISKSFESDPAPVVVEEERNAD